MALYANEHRSYNLHPSEQESLRKRKVLKVTNCDLANSDDESCKAQVEEEIVLDKRPLNYVQGKVVQNRPISNEYPSASSYVAPPQYFQGGTSQMVGVSCFQDDKTAAYLSTSDTSTPQLKANIINEAQPSPTPCGSKQSLTTNQSKYTKIPYFLTNDPNGIKQYREMAEKTNDTTTQLMFAKYLLEVAYAFYPTHAPNKPPAIVGSMWGVCTTKQQQQQQRQSFNQELCPALEQYTAVSDSSHILKRKALEEEAIRWIKRLAKVNVSEACFMLANWMDQELYGYKKNTSKSLQLHMIAAKSNIPESVFAVADYFDCQGVGMEPLKILKYYKSSADHGYVKALYRLAFVRFKGRLGTRQSLEEGLKLLHQACKACSEDFSEPLYVFAQILTNEYSFLDFPDDLLAPYGGHNTAIQYYQRAAKLNNAQAQSKLGSIYEHGYHAESMNFANAFRYYQIAAMNRDPNAMLGLCRLYNRGSHGPGDQDESKRLENDVSGWLASTSVNEELSFLWCEKAAKQGHPKALSLLGWYYESGFGVPRDLEKSQQYYKSAIERGDTSAKSLINKGKPTAKPVGENASNEHKLKKPKACYCM